MFRICKYLLTRHSGIFSNITRSPFKRFNESFSFEKKVKCTLNVE